MNRTRSDFQIERTRYNRPGSTRLHRSSEDRWFLVFTASCLKKNGENWRSFERLRKDGEKGEGKKRKVEKRIFREIGSRITCARRSRIKGGPNVFSRPGTAVFILSSPSVCPRGPWKLLLTRPSLRDFCERKNEIQRTSGVRRPESSETRNGFLRFRRWQDERRVICLLSVDDKARSSPTPLCSSSQNSPRSSPESKGESSPLFLGARVSLCEGYQRGSTSTAGRSAIL